MAEAEYLPLKFYPPTLDLVALKRVFDEARLGVKVQPIAVDRYTTGRILAVGVELPWLCDYVYIDSIDSPDCVNALKWALGFEAPVLPITVLKQLRLIFGVGVKEIKQ